MMSNTPHNHPDRDHDGSGLATGPDAILDANLRAIGTRLGSLPAPDAAQLRSWRGEHAAPVLRLTDTADAPHADRPRRSRWLAAGSALAACIALGVAVLMQFPGSTVQASTIINGLRSKTFGGVNMTFDHVSSRGTTVDGMLRLRLKQPVSIETLEDAHALDGGSHFGAAYGKFTITTDQSVPGWAGARIDAEGALTRGSGWMHVLASDATVRQIAAAEPRAGGIATMAGRGVLLNIGGVDETFFEGLNAIICPEGGPISGSVGRSGLHADMKIGSDGHGGVSVGLKAAPGGASREQMQRFASLARTLLSGKARQGELDQLRGMIQNDFAHQAAVQRLAAGRYLLTAELPDPAGDSAAAGGTLKVCYEEAAGVQWAELSNMRDTTGTIRIEFNADPIAPELLSYDRLVETGKTNYLDLRRVMKLFMPAAKQAAGLLFQ